MEGPHAAARERSCETLETSAERQRLDFLMVMRRRR